MAASTFVRQSGETDAMQERAIGDTARRYRPIVLFVDDDPHDRELYGSILCYNGYDVILTRDGASAIRQATARRPDLVLLDLGLPDVSGLDVCTELGRDERTRDVPVVVLSAFSEARMGLAAREAGCLIYVEKPTTPVSVLHIIESVIGRAPLAGEGEPPMLIDTDPG